MTVPSKRRHDWQIEIASEEILDLSWKAKVAVDWTQWWEHHRHEHARPATRPRDFAGPSPSTESKKGHSQVTPTRRGRAGRGPLGEMEEETPQEVQELEEHLLDSFESQPEPSSQAEMASINWIGRTDQEPNKP